MSEPEIQSLVALVTRSVKIMLPLLLAHGIPNRRTLLVDANIEDLRPNQKHNIVAGDADQRFVASVVIWRVICAVDINADNVACLNAKREQISIHCMKSWAESDTHAILYRALAIVRVRTLPALRLVMATNTA